ncbi:Hypothetical predicted protein [Cloeon dipterum]|uniref:Translation elongation factor EF1B beta/delta subunit guanine nucleotide exchange domain-containing protein n=1 Tax=Cloeon dipterum TaxID=197152 RepID=A0A8S1CXD7_9INSE|nr:Hypothetical predicted protein [Cloeon dipterum]
MGSHEWTNVAALPTCHIDFVLAAVPKHEARSFVRPILHRLILRSATSMSSPLIYERNWADKYKYEDAEKQHFERLAKLFCSTSSGTPPQPEVLTTPSFCTNMPETKLQSPPPQASEESSAAAADKKKKRRKRNNNSTNNAQEAKAQQPAAAAAVAAQPPAPKPQPAAKQPVAAAEPEKAKPQPQQASTKEKKNEVNKKGKKQSPEPEKGPSPPANNQADEKSSLASEVARARQHIKTSLECVDRISTFAVNQGGTDLVNRIVSLEKENEGLRKLVEKMQKSQDALEKRLNELEKKSSSVVSAPKTSAAPAKPAAPQKAAPAPKDDDDDVDLFGSSDEEDESAKQVREQRLAEYAAKKSKKPALIAKSNVILDVKPWDDETDMLELEKAVRSIEMDGLLWGASKKVPLAYGIHKLQISAVIEDEKVSVDLLTEQIEANEDYVQSVDIAAFNKI